MFSVAELLTMNEAMLGRGMPVREDGIGYNKADYGACANYYNGISDAQIADLAKRLVKYSNTQLHIDKEQMKRTAEYYLSKVTGEYDRTNGVSVNVTESGTLISFKYNDIYIEAIKSQKNRQFDAESKQWVVPNSDAVKTLESLREVGADVENALAYVEAHPLVKDAQEKRIDVLMTYGDGEVFIKFDYNQDVLSAIKKLDKSARRWNARHKYWAISNNHFKPLMQSLKDVASFKLMQG